MDNNETLRNFVIENFLFGKSDSLNYDTDFFEKGIIDSTGILELVCFVEENWNIAVEDEELVPDNFSSIKKVGKFVEQKVAQVSKVV